MGRCRVLAPAVRWHTPERGHGPRERAVAAILLAARNAAQRKGAARDRPARPDRSGAGTQADRAATAEGCRRASPGTSDTTAPRQAAATDALGGRYLRLGCASCGPAAVRRPRSRARQRAAVYPGGCIRESPNTPLSEVGSPPRFSGPGSAHRLGLPLLPSVEAAPDVVTSSPVDGCASRSPLSPGRTRPSRPGALRSLRQFAQAPRTTSGYAARC